jgi:S-sulfo-L-cysteine synthase (3-phospho-L-serine-dependent)
MLDRLEVPRLAQLSPFLFAGVLELMKLRVARFLIREARGRGDISDGDRIVESTSGSMGLALAYVCREYGHALTLFGDYAIDASLRIRLSLLGAEVRTIRTPDATGGLQAARLRHLHAFRSRHAHCYWTNQYANPFVLDAYRSGSGPGASKML